MTPAKISCRLTHISAWICKYARAAAPTILFVLLLSTIPARAAVGFVDYSGAKGAVPLAPYLEYLADESGRLNIERVFTQENQSRFSPLSAGLPLNLRGTLWLRFTLPPAPAGLETPFLRLDLGRDAPAGAVLYMPDGNINAALTTWIPQSPVEKNIFVLQLLGFSQQAQMPVTIYIKIPGAVGLWFAPQLLITQEASLKDMPGASILEMLAVFWSWLLSPSSSLVYVVLGVLTVWCLARAFRRGGEWRLWTAVFSVLALLAGMVPMPYAPAGKIPLQALLNVVVPGLCFILLIHVGRHLLYSGGRKSGRGGFLAALSLLGVLLPVLPLIPGLSGLLRIMPLWPVLAVLPALACLGAVAGKTPGARRYMFSCLILALGGVLAWLAAGRPAPSPAMVQAPLWASAVFVFWVGVTHVRERPRQAVPEETPGEDGIEVLRLNDLVSEETMDDLLPPLADSYEPEEHPVAGDGLAFGAAASEREPGPEPEPGPEFEIVEPPAAASGLSFLSMSGPEESPGRAPEQKENKRYALKLVPKLAAVDIPAKMPEHGSTGFAAWLPETPPAEAGLASTGTGLALAEEEPLIELKDIVADNEAHLTMAGGMADEAAPPAPERPGFEPAPEPPGTELGPEPAPEFKLELAPEAPSFAEAADSAPVTAAVALVDAESGAEPTAAAQYEEAEERAEVMAGVETVEAAPPWRRPVGGLKKGIDLLGDLIRHGDAQDQTELTQKEPVLVGPDLLKGQLAAAQWAGRAQEVADGALTPGTESQPEFAESGFVAEAGASEESPRVEPDVDAFSGAAQLSTPGIDFEDMVDETAHADALWSDGDVAGQGDASSAASLENDQLASQTDAWKLSDMGHHGSAPREEAMPPSRADVMAARATSGPSTTAQSLAAAEADLQVSLGALQALLESPGRSGQDLYQAVREQSQAILAAGYKIADQVRQTSGPGQTEPEAQPLDDLSEDGGGENREEVFDLQLVLINAHEAVRGEAERKNLALSWFMPPHLPLLYLGDPPRLQEVLRRLLDSAVAATDKGSVQLAVRRVPDSTDPGHLIFSVADSARGEDAARRSPLALKQAWSLAAASGGGLNVESMPGQGSTVAFTMRLKRPADDLYGSLPGLDGDTAMLHLHSGGTESLSIISRQENHILVVDEQATNRQLIAFFLGNLPYRIVEAKSLDEAMAIYAQRPTGLVILDSQLEGLEVPEALRRLHGVDNSLKLSPVPVVALIQDHDAIAAMLGAGCKGTLRKPLSRKRVRDLVQTLLPRDDALEAEEAAASALEPGGADRDEGPKEPVKGSPEDYVSHLEFSILEESGESGAVVENSAQDAGLDSPVLDAPPHAGPEQTAASAREPERNIMAGLDFLHLGASALRTEAESVAKDDRNVAKEPGPEKLGFDSVQSERARLEKDKAPAPVVGRSRWLSGFLDAAGKVAGAVAPQGKQSPEIAREEQERLEPFPLDAQSLKTAPPEQLDRIPRVLDSLDAALWDAKHGLAEENCLAVSRACLHLAEIADRHNLTNLDRIARCVDRAAQANDLEAVHDLLSELEASVGRNRRQIKTALE